jgi:hypothetical protein
MRDNDAIIGELRDTYPAITAEQLDALHPGADDNGLWFFRHSDSGSEVQLESSSGNTPFLIESSGSAQRLRANTVPEAVAMVVAGLGITGSAA